MLSVITALIILCCLAAALFETKKINVTGNQHTSAQEVREWVKSGKYSSNTLYILWKYNKDDIRQLPTVEKTKVKLKYPWEVNVQVTEKTFSGCVDIDGESLYFDKDGMVCFKTADVIEGIPHIEGMELDIDKVKLGKKLPVTDEKVFEAIHSITGLLNKAELIPDKISCNGSDLTLYFGVVRVQIGNGNYAGKLNQAASVLAKLQELYPGQAGVLHLENYVNTDSHIRFVPDPPPAETAEGETTEDTAGATEEGNDWDEVYGEGTWDQTTDTTWDVSGEAVWQ